LSIIADGARVCRRGAPLRLLFPSSVDEAEVTAAQRNNFSRLFLALVAFFSGVSGEVGGFSV